MRDTIGPYEFTVDQFLQIAEAGVLDPDVRLELIDGLILKMAPSSRAYANRVSDIVRALNQKIPLDIEASIQSTIRLNDWTAPAPDIALLTPEASLDEVNLPRPADILLIAEVSASTPGTAPRDKVTRYAQSGIPELWILVMTDDEIEVCRQPTPSGYADVRRLGRGDTLTIQALAEVQVPVDELLAQLKSPEVSPQCC